MPTTTALRSWLRTARRQFTRAAIPVLAAMALTACSHGVAASSFPF